jgi:hypothetical protein
MTVVRHAPGLTTEHREDGHHICVDAEELGPDLAPGGMLAEAFDKIPALVTEPTVVNLRGEYDMAKEPPGSGLRGEVRAPVVIDGGDETL